MDDLLCIDHVEYKIKVRKFQEGISKLQRRKEEIHEDVCYYNFSKVGKLLMLKLKVY